MYMNITYGIFKLCQKKLLNFWLDTYSLIMNILLLNKSKYVQLYVY